MAWIAYEHIQVHLDVVTLHAGLNAEAARMTAYLLGNLTGRFALSYALVWIVLFAVLSKLSWREAFRRTHHWSGLTAVVTLFLLGLIAAQPSGAQP